MTSKIKVEDFRRNLNQLLTALEARGFNEIEAIELGDFIGKVIPCEAGGEPNANKALYDQLVNGLHHGLGLSHNKLNTSESIEQTVLHFESGRKDDRLKALAELSRLDQEMGLYDK